MGKQAAFTVIALLAVGLLLAAGCSRPWRSYEAVLVLSDIAAADSPSRLKHTTRKPQRITVGYWTDGRMGQGDLYQPATETRAALLLIPGVAETGKDDPRLVAFATTLARAGFAVLVPDLFRLRQLQVSPADVGEVADAFDWLVSDPCLAPQGRAGMAAFSYAAGPVLLAAREESIRARVRFVFVVGGYYDLPQVLTFFTTGYYRHHQQWHYLRPNDYGKWAFVAANLHHLEAANDRRLLREMAERKQLDPAAPVADLAAGLGAEGRTLYALINNRDPQQTPALLAALPATVRSDLRTLDLANKDWSHLAARVILVHGLDDPMIPFPQSVALAEALPQGRSKLFLVRGLVHVDVAPGLPDRWRLWRAVKSLLAARDGKL